MLGRGLKWARRRPSHTALAGLGLATAIGALAGPVAHQARLRVEIDHTRRAATEARAQRALAEANYWGNLAARRGQPDLGLDRHTRGLALVGPVLGSQPTLSEPRLAALNLHGSRANLLGALGRHAEAVPDWDRVFELNDVPADATTYRLLRLFALLKSGDHARGAVEIERVERPPPGVRPPADADLYNVACFYALASAAARNDATLPQERRTRLAQSYAQRSLDRLRRCAESGFLNDPANRDHARVDPDLASIRDRPEFSQILGAGPPPGPPGPPRPQS